MRFSIRKKFLVAFLVISLAPLVALSFYARRILVVAGSEVQAGSKQALLETSASLLEARARSIARQVELFLEGCREDLAALALLPFDPELYLDFSQGHRREIWTRTGGGDCTGEERRQAPLYREITYAAPEGVERIRVLSDQVVTPGRHVAGPFWGAFGREDFFREARALEPGAPYVSHLMGRHVRPEEQLRGAADVECAVGGTEYAGIIRFAAPVYRNGAFAGVVSLALDHRHLMEYTQHVLPVGDHEVVFPSYASGNYAFLFDDEGWIITHPKFWDIRGHDRETGKLVDPAGPDYTEAAMRAGRIPFNLFHVPFIHPNYARIAEAVLEGESGVTTTSSVGDVPRVMAYAPIRFTDGEYAATGFFGGVTLGARTETFHGPAESTASAIRDALNATARDFGGIILATALVVAAIAVFLAGRFTRPIQLLSEQVGEVGAGHFDVSVDIRSGDELETLGRGFEKMASQLEQHRRDLVRSLEAREASRREALRERDFIRAVFGNVPSGLAVIGEDGRITTVNRNTERILGLPPGGMAGQPAEALLADHPALLGLIRRGLAGERSGAADIDIQTETGRRNIEATASRMPDGEEKGEAGVLVVLRDITRRKRMEEMLRRSDRLVSLGTLAAGVAHEIRNPLTGISLMLDDLHDRMVHREGDQVLMRRAMEEIEKLETIVTELLEFASKPSEGFEAVDLRAVIHNTLFLIKKQCKRQNVLLVENLPDDIPPLRLDPERMKQALLNILLNALNVMPDGGELHIIVLVMEDAEMFSGGRGLEIRICDTGPGVDPADMDYLFDPFFTRSPKGSGLGLSITHTIIEEHGGKIMVDSKLGRGACFKIFFSLNDDEADDAEDSGGG